MKTIQQLRAESAALPDELFSENMHPVTRYDIWQHEVFLCDLALALIAELRPLQQAQSAEDQQCAFFAEMAKIRPG